MHIDWSSFTPWSAAIGGLIIGFAVALFILVNGRIAGISGIVGGMLRPARGDIGWRLAFVAGLLVGTGTRYASGCTSGHGVCGVARLSPRSLVATAAFMIAGFATVFVVRHLAGA